MRRLIQVCVILTLSTFLVGIVLKKGPGVDTSGFGIVAAIVGDDGLNPTTGALISIIGDTVQAEKGINTDTVGDTLILSFNTEEVTSSQWGANHDFSAFGATVFEVPNDSIEADEIREHDEFVWTGQHVFNKEIDYSFGAPDTFAFPDATPDTRSRVFWETNATAETITNFTGFSDTDEGNIIWVKSKGNTTFDCTGSNLRCGSTDLATQDGDLTVWFDDNATWILVSYHDQSADAGGAGTDTSAIHDNVATEFVNVPAQKVTPTAADILLIEDSADSFAKKFIAIGTIPGILTVQSKTWGAGSWSSDGINCAEPVEVTINSGPKQFTVVCNDGADGTFEGSWVLPDSFVQANDVNFSLKVIQTAADTGSVDGDIKIQCKGDDEQVDNTWETTNGVMDLTNVDGSNDISDIETSGNLDTGSGAEDCDGGDAIYWHYTMDDSDTTSANTTLHYTQMVMEGTWGDGD